MYVLAYSTHTQVHVHVCICAYACTYMCTYTYSMQTHVLTYTYVLIYKHAHTHICTYISMQTCVAVHTRHKYIHTYSTQTFPKSLWQVHTIRDISVQKLSLYSDTCNVTSNDTETYDTTTTTSYLHCLRVYSLPEAIATLRQRPTLYIPLAELRYC